MPALVQSNTTATVFHETDCCTLCSSGHSPSKRFEPKRVTQGRGSTLMEDSIRDEETEASACLC